MEELLTPRLLLRRFRSGDWRDLHAYLSRPEVVAFEPYGVFDEAASRAEAEKRSREPCFWAVCLREGGRLIGNVYFGRSGPEELRTWELGYVFHPDFQGRGYAAEACRRVLEHGFSTLGAHRVTAQCNPLNARSWRLLERLGMRREGHFKSNVFFKTDGAGRPLWVDTYAYALLAAEWAGGGRSPQEEETHA